MAPLEFADALTRRSSHLFLSLENLIKKAFEYGFGQFSAVGFDQSVDLDRAVLFVLSVELLHAEGPVDLFHGRNVFRIVHAVVFLRNRAWRVSNITFVEFDFERQSEEVNFYFGSVFMFEDRAKSK